MEIQLWSGENANEPASIERLLIAPFDNSFGMVNSGFPLVKFVFLRFSGTEIV